MPGGTQGWLGSFVEEKNSFAPNRTQTQFYEWSSFYHKCCNKWELFSCLVMTELIWKVLSLCVTFMLPIRCFWYAACQFVGTHCTNIMIVACFVTWLLHWHSRASICSTVDKNIVCLILPGITNHDEYSLVREDQEEELENKPNFGTLTLKRKKEEKERDSKMDQLRKKLKTDDEGKSLLLYIVIY